MTQEYPASDPPSRRSGTAALSPSRSVLVVGAGPVGHAILAGLSAVQELEVRHWSRSHGPMADPTPADVAVLAVRDDAIDQAARYLLTHGAAGPDTVLLHCAGALPPAEAFAGQLGQVAGVGLLHPLRALTTGAGAGELIGTVMAVCGDQQGVAMALLLAQALQGVPLLLSPEQLGAYHGAAVLAAGHVAALLWQGVAVLEGIGLQRAQAEQALAALCGSVAQNVAQVGLPAALTGPVARGDVATVRRHLQALPAVAPEAARLYLAILPAVIALAAAKGAAAPADLEQMKALADRPLIAPSEAARPT